MSGILDFLGRECGLAVTGGMGTSIEDAIILHPSEEGIIDLEYQVITELLMKENRVWELKSQELLTPNFCKYDRFEVYTALKDESGKLVENSVDLREFFFDINLVYGGY